MMSQVVAPDDEGEEETPADEGDTSGDDDDEKITDGDTSPANDDGEELPKTATPIFNVLLIGVVLIVIGGIALYLVKRRRHNAAD